jgi:uncharacterized protein with PIN domain
MNKESVMGAMKAHPRYNVVSIRVSDEELEALQDVCRECNKSVSTIMREAMSQLSSEALGSGCRYTTG